MLLRQKLSWIILRKAKAVEIKMKLEVMRLVSSVYSREYELMKSLKQISMFLPLCRRKKRMMQSWLKNWVSKDAEPWQQPGEVERRSLQETHTRTKEADPKTPRSTTT